MKKLLFMIIALLVFSGAEKATAKEFQDQYGYSRTDVEGRFGYFYSSLSPYGEWVDCNYGYAWRPYRVGQSWRPYQDGRWVWSSDGWYWMSYEPFGWATYHYGRWIYDDYYGWIWTPDDVWGPAWVEWRYDNDYIGWAPLPPMAQFSFGIGLTFSNRWVSPVHYWNFVPCRSFTSTRIVDYVQPIERTRRFFGNTRQTINIRSENDRVINNGVDVGFVERRGDVRINRVDVVENGRGNGERLVRENNRERLEVFRPRLDRNGDAQQPRRTPPANDNRGYDRQQPRVPFNESKGYDRQQPRVPAEERPQRQRQETQQQDERRNSRGGAGWVQPQQRREQRQEQAAPREQRRENAWVQPRREREQQQQPPQFQQREPRRNEMNYQRPRRDDQRQEGEQKSKDRSRDDRRPSGRGRRP